MYSNPFLYAFYQFMKGLVKLCFALYYPNTRVTGREHLRLKGPTFIATNHPNTLLDPLNAASRVDEQVFFLANAGLFKTPFQKWFFNTFYCIPIERPQDTDGRPVDNRTAFARSTAHLEKGGHLYIAPEGTSLVERALRPLKTGAARLALTAEEANDFKLNTRILPIGLNYERQDKFGTKLLINVGAPVLISEFEEDCQTDAYQSAKQITQQLDERFRQLLVDTHSEAEDRLVRHLETLLQSTAPTDQRQHFKRTKKLIQALRLQRETNPEAYRQFEQRVLDYFSQVEALRLSDKVVSSAMNDRPQRTGLYIAGLLLSFPLFLYGLLNNFLPYFIPKWITRRLNLYIGYHSSAKILMGLITFPLFYGLQTWLAASFFSRPLPLLYFLSLIPAGYFAHAYPSFFRHLRAIRYWRYVQKKTPAAADALVTERREIWKRAMSYLS